MVGLRGRFREGFTLVELLVAIAIIGVLIGLVLPAVQMVRESARRTQCRTNLRNLALAIQSFETAHRAFPAGYVVNHAAADLDPGTLDASPGTGWGLAIAAYLEDPRAAGVVRPADPTWGVASPRTADVVAATLPGFLCGSAAGPRDPFLVRKPDGSPHPSGARLGRSHYVANAGHADPWDEPAPRLTWDGVANGPLYRNSRIRAGQVTDGLAQTVFLGEHTSAVSEKAWAGVVPGAASHPGERVATLLGGTADAAAALVLVHSGPAEDELRIIHAPNDPAAHADQMFSDHRGGAHVAFGDGAVRFISELIHQPTWAAMSSINGGEPLTTGEGE
jgi:prepilin-type N-terminal cleavage/methylation domain-containing protein